ncbi:glycosyl hydrolase family 16 [Flavobacterium ponti]|uniref:Glycosyl hydrolase family 16 n=1 Tax=Flavobacterium ponti TaxID=665133 RepID=A0ABV9P9S5_9FLAO
MKNKRINYLKNTFLLGLVVLTGANCERDLSDDAVDATFSKTGEVFTDLPVGMGSNFYFPYGGSKPTAWSVDNEVSYKGSASMRFDVPNADDPEGNYAGAIFRIDGAGRDLSGYDALTFWAKSSQGVSIDEIGFGEDFIENKYIATITNVSIGTNWTKYVIPIPDASKLVQERGMLRYAAGTQGTGGLGYTFWIDELRFEKLGTIAHPMPKILDGVDVNETTFIGSTSTINGLTETFNLGNGSNQTVIVAPSYYTFISSNPGVASVNELGLVNIVGSSPLDSNMNPIPTTITATLGGILAEGSLTYVSLGNFTSAPVPTRDPANVLSIFSNAYTNVPVEYYNGYWGGSTTLGQDDIHINGDDIIKYSQLNYVGIQFAQPTLNATQMTHFHIDLQVQNANGLGNTINIKLADFGANGVFGGGDDSEFELPITNANLPSGDWVSLDIPFSSFTGLTSRAHLAQVVLVSASGITDILVDNIYFYKVPTTPTIAAPTPTLPAANVISLFSDQYTNVPVDTWKTSWSSATFADVTIAGNATKEYSNLDFVGIETVNNQINASAMTHVHIDVWSANFTSFSLKLVDFGANGAFGGGDDSEYQLNFPAPTQGQWISYDLPLSSFTGLLAKQHLAQYILVAQPTGSAKVYIDNFYFHN